MKKKIIWSVAAVAAAALITIGILFACGVFTPSNGKKYDVSSCTMQENSPLRGKTIYWLGSSVTLGMASEEQAVADFLQATTGCICVKEAVSGTTLIDKPYKTLFSSEDSYVTRLKESEAFDTSAEIDAFICQISTNDAKAENLPLWGELTADGVTDKAAFDVQTTLGAMEYIVAYVEEVWDCPVYFYSGSYIAESGVRASKDPRGSDYAKLVDYTYDLAEKWNKAEGVEVGIIDLFNDEAFNAVSDEQYRVYMHDPVHPFKAGYKEWWTPYFDKYLSEQLG